MKTTAKDIMTKKVLKATEGISIEEGIRLLINNGITGLPVVDKKDKMVGVLSEYDILRSISKTKKLSMDDFKKAVEFNKEVHSVEEDTDLDEIIKDFVDSRFRRVFVVDKNKKLVGIISRRDLMRLFYYRARLGQ